MKSESRWSAFGQKGQKLARSGLMTRAALAPTLRLCSRLFFGGEGLAITGFFLCRLPWWGISWLNHPEWPRWIGRILQHADTFGSLLALALLWWALHRKAPTRHTQSVRPEHAEVS